MSKEREAVHESRLRTLFGIDPETELRGFRVVLPAELEEMTIDQLRNVELEWKDVAARRSLLSRVGLIKEAWKLIPLQDDETGVGLFFSKVCGEDCYFEIRYGGKLMCTGWTVHGGVERIGQPQLWWRPVREMAERALKALRDREVREEEAERERLCKALSGG